MPHICMDEIFALLAILGGVRYIPGWVRAVWNGRHWKPNCKHSDACESFAKMKREDV